MVVFAVVSVGASLFFIQQFSGINAVVFFSTAVFRGAGIKSDVAASALVALSNVIGVCPFPMLLLSISLSYHFLTRFYCAGSIVASSQMDKKGRKYLLITSFGGMVCSTSTSTDLFSIIPWH